jgi:hypothetical protein
MVKLATVTGKPRPGRVNKIPVRGELFEPRHLHFPSPNGHWANALKLHRQPKRFDQKPPLNGSLTIQIERRVPILRTDLLAKLSQVTTLGWNLRGCHGHRTFSRLAHSESEITFF